MIETKIPIPLRLLMLSTTLICVALNYKRIWGHRHFEKFAFVVLVISGVIWAASGRWRQLVVVSAIYFLVAYGPVDYIRLNRYDYPRIIPVLMGLPNEKALEEYKKGDIWLTGCVVYGSEPKWVIVW